MESNNRHTHTESNETHLRQRQNQKLKTKKQKHNWVCKKFPHKHPRNEPIKTNPHRISQTKNQKKQNFENKTEKQKVGIGKKVVPQILIGA